MTSIEQPPKKRKLYDPSQPPPPSQPPSPPPPPPPPPYNSNDDPTPQPPQTPPPLSSEEIQLRRRNQGDIRNVYENYKTIQRCISSGKDPRLLPELEEAYLSLISSSRGCPSVQRILSEVIPCYASYCPTALEAAALVVINMHNWNVPLISRGEDLVGVSFETAKNCIAGLIDICCTASRESPTSSVIQGICSVVFLSAATFFANSFEGKDIFQIIDKESLKMQDSALSFTQLKQRVLEQDASPVIKLMKFRALCFLRILFLCPKNLLAACFELFSNHGADGFCIEGKYFLTQLCYTVNFDGQVHLSEIFKEAERFEANTDDMRLEKNDLSHGRPDFDHESSQKNKGSLECCLLGLVLCRDTSLKKWVFSRYRRLQNSASSEAVFQVTSAFQRIFESFGKQVQDTGETDDDSLDSSRYASRQSLVHGTSSRQRNFHENSGKDFSSHHHDKPFKNDLTKNVSGPYLKRHSSIVSVNSDSHSNTSSNHDSGGSKRMDIDSKEDGNRCHTVSGSNPALYPLATSNQIVWYSDGDARAMDVFSASRQLWLGSLAPDVSEAALRFELERFGPIENFMFFHVKQFLLVEYESIIDAIKARDFFQRYSPWGYPIHVKFIDAGLGTRGALEDVAIGSSCHVFVGNVLNQWVRDEIVRETMKVVHRGPRLVTELTSEGALLLEFENPEEAANAMACIRQSRKGNNSFRQVISGPTDISRPCPRFWNSGPTSVSSNIGNMCNTFLGSPHGQAVGSPSNRMHQSNLHFKMNPESTPPEFLSPRVGIEQGSTFQSAQMIQSNMTSSVCMDTPGTSGSTIVLPQPIQASPYMQPLYPLPSNSWDAQGFSHHIPLNTVPPGVMSSNIHSTPAPSPFIQASVTPMSQVPGSSVHSYNHILSQPFEPPPMPSIPNPQFDLPPPLPPSPPMVPPPPSIGPPSSTTEPSSLVTAWQGTLSKSGVHFCNIYANRLDTDFCRYSTSVSEPAGWPVKLDMTKRTDCRHIKATFTSTPPHRREVCQLFPSSAADHKGFQDFISYLKQRDCAGVIKIPSMKPLWARLLFILPNSSEACLMLSMTYDATDCLIAVVLPKEANVECA